MSRSTGIRGIIDPAVESSHTGSTDATLVTQAAGPRRVQPPLARGSAIGRYLVLDVIGRGGMGTVVLADDPELDRRIALKLVDASGREHAEILREAQALARLSHPNVVAVHDVGRDGERVYIAMEYVRGQTLRAWQSARPRAIDEILAVYLAAGRGLAAAHAAGVVHRDFKPDNAIVGEDGVVRVLDFGLATTELPQPRTDEEVSAERSDPEHRAAKLRGTPAYMAPEQRLGLAIGPAADQYAFALALLEALCGQRPLPLAPAALTRGEALVPPPAATTVPARLRRALLRALATAAHERFASMTQLLDALQLASPRRRRTRALVATALAGLAATSFGLARLTDTTTSECGDTHAILDAVWGAQPREAVMQAFAAADVPWAATTRTTAMAGIDAWAASWAETREATCVAAFRSHELDAGEARRRIDCLDDHLERTRALVELFAAGDPDVLARAVDSTAALPEPQVCTEAASFDDGMPPPDTREQLEEVRRIRAALSQAEELAAAHRYDAARELAEQLLRDATASGYEPIRVRALRVRARAEADPARSVELHLVAIAAAIAIGDRALAGRAGLTLVHSLNRLGLYDEAKRWGRMIDSVIATVHDDRLQLAALVDRANLAASRGEWVHARVAADAAVALAAHAMPPDSVKQIPPLAALANVIAYSAPSAEGVAAARRAWLLASAAYGDDHPTTVATRRAFTAQYVVGGELEVALPSMAAEYAAAAAIDPHGSDAAGAQWNLAVALVDAGRWRRAQIELDGASAYYRATEGPDGETLAHAMAIRAVIALGLGELARARVDAQDAIARLRRVAPGHAPLGVALSSAGIIAVADHRDRDARDLLVEALTLLTPALGADRPSVLEAEAVLALAELRLGLPEGRARLERVLPRAAALSPAIARARVEVYALAALRLADPSVGEPEWRAFGRHLSTFGLAGDPVRDAYARLDAP
ncbi:MAG: serine/threonine protein kinase [Nannocystaceae bacterium]|nr:serine/threonine protein kinase [Nannocystaceae bacterium]